MPPNVKVWSCHAEASSVSKSSCHESTKGSPVPESMLPDAPAVPGEPPVPPVCVADVDPQPPRLARRGHKSRTETVARLRLMKIDYRLGPAASSHCVGIVKAFPVRG